MITPKSESCRFRVTPPPAELSTNKNSTIMCSNSHSADILLCCCFIVLLAVFLKFFSSRCNVSLVRSWKLEVEKWRIVFMLEVVSCLSVIRYIAIRTRTNESFSFKKISIAHFCPSHSYVYPFFPMFPIFLIPIVSNYSSNIIRQTHFEQNLSIYIPISQFQVWKIILHLVIVFKQIISPQIYHFNI